jgi:hypothetical protein
MFHIPRNYDPGVLTRPRWPARGALVLSWILIQPIALAVGAVGQLELRVTDDESGKPLAVTMHLWDAKGRSRKVRGVPKVGDQFVVDGTILLKLAPGNYRFKLQRGLEYLDREGNFVIRPHATDNHAVTMKRFVNMAALGWQSADLGDAGAVTQLDAALRAVDLHRFLGTTSSQLAWTNRLQRFEERTVDLRGVFNTQRQLAVLRIDKPPPWISELSVPATRLLKFSRSQPDSHCCALDIAALNFPMWVASGALDVVTIMAPWSTAWPPNTFRPDTSKFPGRRGAARWRERLYHLLLETGLKIAPSACSYSPHRRVVIGSSRTYVMVPAAESNDAAEGDQAFWNALSSGQSMLTDGPIIMAKINGQPPGFVFDGFSGETVGLKPTLTLHTKEKISYLEILKNGDTIHQVRLDDWVRAKGELPTVEFTQSGWLLVRAVVDDGDQYRFAMTAPSYVQFEAHPRISATATSFYLDWARRRLHVAEGELGERYHAAAVRFWEARLASANAP